jgi:hypothetical protein
MESCIVLLKTRDFGFVHQILTFKRLTPDSLGSFTHDMSTLITGHLYSLVMHGRDFLTEEEFKSRLKHLTAEYYNLLAVSILRGRRDKRFWHYHKRKLAESNVGFSRTRLLRALLARLCRAVLNSYETVRKLQDARGHGKPQRLGGASRANGFDASLRSKPSLYLSERMKQ